MRWGRTYEKYFYDPVGNFSQMQHFGTNPSNPIWKRTYAYQEPSQLEPCKFSNRLTSAIVNGTPETYSVGGNGYDAHGNMLQMPQLQAIAWDFKDQMQMTQQQAVNAPGTAGQQTYYAYDASGQRVIKVTASAIGALIQQRIYIGGFEIYRKYNSSSAVSLERQTLHVMDDKQRVALIETKTIDASSTALTKPNSTLLASPVVLIRFQFTNHLGSALLELDNQENIISYEEYYPYGCTSYQSVNSSVSPAAKRYRYTGKERDEESGLYYYRARYYAPWLGRWTAIDPAGVGSSAASSYDYCRSNPVVMLDPAATLPAFSPHPSLHQYSPHLDYWQRWRSSPARPGMPSKVGPPRHSRRREKL